MRFFELAEAGGILNRGTQPHRVKTKYHRSSEYDDSFEDYDDDPLESALDKVQDRVYHKYTPEEEEALIKAGIATHTKKEAKKLTRKGEYPVENFRAKPNMTVKFFYWPNKEIGKPYTVFH